MFFKNGVQETFTFPSLDVQPLPVDYENLEFDAASRTSAGEWDHSPRCCNGLWDQVVVNKYCLVNDSQEAFRLGREFSITGNAQLGPYFMAKVLRKRRP